MAADRDTRPDAVAELVRALREQVTQHADHIAELERRLVAANQRIADQQRLLARLLEKSSGSRAPVPLPSVLALPAQPRLAPESRPGRIREIPGSSASDAAPAAVVIPTAGQGAPCENAASLPTAQPAGDRIHLPRADAGAPPLDSIASAVLLARDSRNDSPQDVHGNASHAVAREPTTGIVRAAGGPDSPEEERETTLTLDREELARGHRAAQGGRRWFPFSRR